MKKNSLPLLLKIGYMIFLILFITSPKLCSFGKYQIGCDSVLLTLSEKIMIKQVGTIEKTGKNDGNMIEIYQNAVGLGKGSSYCAAGIYWCFSAATDLLIMRSECIPIPKTGLANLIYSHAKANGIRVNYIPQRHDLIVWRYPSSSFGHIERIIQTKKAGWVVTVSFNTSKKQNGTGKKIEGVFIKKRNIFHPLGRMLIRGLVGFRNEHCN